MTSTPLLEIRNVSKAFPGVKALTEVSLAIQAGMVHALVGENGAGKSTLTKILAGAYQPDSGEVYWEGQRVILANPAAAQRLGISIIYQEFNLLPHLSVAENILLNREPRTRFLTIDWSAMLARARELLRLLQAEIDPRAEVGRLSVAQQQLVEIAKALAIDARLIIMDEPTAALNPIEVRHLFDTVRRLKERGTTVIFISHRLDEVLDIGTTITVLKDGRVVESRPAADLSKEEMVRLMVGRELADTFPPKSQLAADDELLAVDGLTTGDIRDVSFSLRSGEIVGVAGLEGHGQAALARAISGLDAIASGTVRLAGQPLRLRHPDDAIRAGIAFVSEDRKAEGLALVLSVRENVSLPNLPRFSRYGVVASGLERRAISAAVRAVGVKTPSIEQVARFLSGGNQQKTVLAKWLVGDPRLFLFVEPTRGIDVGAKVEIYHLMRDLAARGAGIVMVTSDMLELLGMADRILVMRDGRLAAELAGAEATEEAVMLAATGVAA
ncbi:MAG: sugar ABC transporter ATP-binding protein [Candidatus Limnocylindria bacterium]